MEEGLEENSKVGPEMGSNEGQESFAGRLFDTALTVDKYYTPLLFLFGTLGNSLSVAVFCMNAKYRNQSASYYLSALAISDTGFLINLLAVWLENVHGGVITSGLLCPLVMYLGQVTCFMSVYLTVAFSVERFVAVHYPLSRPRICTRSKARKVIAALTVVALLAFSYAWVIAQVIEVPSRGDDYEDVYSDTIPNNSWNTTQEDSLELLPAEERVKRESFPLNNLPPQDLLTSYKETKSNQLNNVVGNVQGCGNENRTIYTDPFPSQAESDSQQNCGRFHSDGTISKIFDHSFSSETADRESSTSASAENLNNMMNLDRSEEDGGSFSSGSNYICSVPKDYYRISEIANYLDSVVTLIIPFFLITFFNVRIAICVWKLRDQRQSIVANTTTNINYHHNNSSLRCSTKYSISRIKNPKKNAEDDNVEGGGLRQHVSNHKDNGNGIIGSGRDENLHRKSQKGTVRFDDGSHKLNGTESSINDGTLASFESDEGRVADNLRDDDDDDNSIPRSGCGNSRDHEITLKANKMSTADELGSKSTKFIRRPISSEHVPKGVKIKWEQDFSEQSSFPQRVAVRPELSVVKERGSSHHPSSNAAEVRVTKTLLLVSTVFLVLNVPAHAIRCAIFIQSLRGTSDGNELLHAAQPWTNILFNTNFAVNFLLYCVSGRNFRKSLKNIILRKFNKNKTNAWKPVKTCLKNEGSLRQIAGGGLNRNCRNSMKDQVTEIVELEDRAEESIYPTPNQANADGSYNGEVEESMTMTV